MNYSEPDDAKGLTFESFQCFLREIDQQPAWRAKADREMEYVDGNQLSSDILQKQAAIGMPPAVEPLIGPALDGVTGLEAKTRTDWRVTPDHDKSGDDVAAALNHKLNQTERQAKADDACTDAFLSQAAVGLGWVEVSRESDPFKYRYRCKAVHRNELWWDFLSGEPDLSDARYLVRRRWTDKSQVLLKWPEKADLIRFASSRWFGVEDMTLDGGQMTDLAMAYNQERGWSVEEQQWRDIENKRVCLFEVWYRVWVRVTILKMGDGRIVEFDPKNDIHNQAIAAGLITPESAVVAKMRVSMWMGPHRLSDGPTPYRHSRFPYVPFWGKREDRTGVPYGLVRGMMYMQDNVNATQSKIRWGLAAVMTIRTDGAVRDDDEAFRQQVARIDADIVLDPVAMAKPGAVFKVERNFQLNEQQYKMLVDSREGIKRTGSTSDALTGRAGSATSGVQEATQVEQATQALATLMANFKTGRSAVGELLMSMIVADLIGKQETVLISGNGLKPDRTIALNQPAADEDTGLQYLNNDVERTLLKVGLAEVPSTSSFRAQQLAALSEAFKAMPQNLQVVALPHLLNLTDVPDKEAIIEAIQQAIQQATPEQIQQQIDEAVKQALAQSGAELKLRELNLKYSPEMMTAQLQKLNADAVKVGVEAAFASIQTAASIVQTPQISPVADVIIQGAGYRPPTPAGVDPNFPIPQAIAPVAAALPGVPPVQANTSPGLPPVPQAPGSPMTGIETPRTTDGAAVPA